MPKKLERFVLLAAFLLAAGCSVTVQTELPTAAAPAVITATLPASPTPRPSETPLPPPPTPTVAPVPGTTSTQLNVRAEPSTTGAVLGILAPNSPLQIVGRDPGGNWWQIVYEAGADGKGWVTAQYVTTTGGPEVPVIGGQPESGDSAAVIQQLNIRSGPGTSFNSIGILNANDVVSLTGRNRDGSWLQIAFPGGPDGRGWVNAAFIKAVGADGLPIVADSGEVLGTGTPMDTPPPPTPTLLPASMDFDSAEAPLKTVRFERGGTQALIYSGDVSAPDGDPADWIAFTPYGDLVFAQIQCAGNGSLTATVPGSEISLPCNGAVTAIPVLAGATYIVHIQAAPTAGGLGYVQYTLTVRANP